MTQHPHPSIQASKPGRVKLSEAHGCDDPICQAFGRGLAQGHRDTEDSLGATLRSAAQFLDANKPDEARLVIADALRDLERGAA